MEIMVKGEQMAHNDTDILVNELPRFDMSKYLNTPEDIDEYLQEVLEDGDASELAYALGVIAKAKGMTEIAEKSGISRESLYKALRKNSSPRLDTINKVIKSLGLKLSITRC